MKRHLFTPTVKLAELLDDNPQLVLLLSRWNIPLGFGEKTVAEVCAEQGVSPVFFLIVCRIYSDRCYLPDEETLSMVEMDDMIRYLHASHIYYLQDRIPHIGNHLQHIVEQCEPVYRSMIRRFYDAYCHEVEEHFKYEEETVFPYIRALMEGAAPSGYRIRDFQKNHSNIEDKLHDLRNILIKYLPAELSPADRISITIDTYRLSEDVERHSVIEEQVLVPAVMLMERKRDGKGA